MTTYLNDRRRSEVRFGAQTFNFYLQAVKQFALWMVKDRRVFENLLSHLDGVNVRTDRRHGRRALSVEELQGLLEAAWNGPERQGRHFKGKVAWRMTGLLRSMLFRLTMETGLRSSELRSLTRESFDLNSQPPTVVVEAAYSKHKRRDSLPLRAARLPRR